MWCWGSMRRVGAVRCSQSVGTHVVPLVEVAEYACINPSSVSLPRGLIRLTEHCEEALRGALP
jgi:hypothetical protein